MALERKRGKLGALNALLQTGDRAAFVRIVGNTELLGVVRYVITLDAGSQLPRDGARALVGTLAHPLNHARFDDARRIVTAGYGILHPRVTTLMSGQRGSRYASVYGGETGIDPYTRAVSDVYQDLFGEGSFVGKGIYDVDAFERALGGRVPGQPGPQPRPARGLLRPGRSRQRRAALRTPPPDLRRRCGAPVSLDTR